MNSIFFIMAPQHRQHIKMTTKATFIKIVKEIMVNKDFTKDDRTVDKIERDVKYYHLKNAPLYPFYYVTGFSSHYKFGENPIFDRTVDSFEKDGFAYDVVKYYYNKENMPFYNICRCSSNYKHYDEMIFDKRNFRQSIYIDMVNNKLNIHSYRKDIRVQTACRLCYNADKKTKCNEYFILNKHNKTKKHLKNVQMYVDAIMDTTKLNNDVCNLIMSYL